MNEIRGLMQFRVGQIVRLALHPNADKDPTASLEISAELSPELAEQMRCRDAVFGPDDKPHANVTRFDLGGTILRDVDLSLPSGAMEGAFDTCRPEDIARFRIIVDGMIARIHMLARIKGRYLELVDFLEKQNTDNFEFAIRALQQEFDWSGKGGAGESVDMSGVVAGKKESQCPLFEPPVCAEVVDGSGPEERTAEPALPEIHVTSNGKRKRQLTRGEVASIEEAKRRPRNEHPEMRGDIAAEHHPADGEPVFPVN